MTQNNQVRKKSSHDSHGKQDLISVSRTIIPKRNLFLDLEDFLVIYIFTYAHPRFVVNGKEMCTYEMSLKYAKNKKHSKKSLPLIISSEGDMACSNKMMPKNHKLVFEILI